MGALTLFGGLQNPKLHRHAANLVPEEAIRSLTYPCATGNMKALMFRLLEPLPATMD